jgi:hypothetical protein
MKIRDLKINQEFKDDELENCIFEITDERLYKITDKNTYEYILAADLGNGIGEVIKKQTKENVFKELKEKEKKLAENNILERYNHPEYYLSENDTKEDILERYYYPEYFCEDEMEKFEDILTDEISLHDFILLLDCFEKCENTDFFIIRKERLIELKLEKLAKSNKKYPKRYIEKIKEKIKNLKNMFDKESYEEIMETISFLLKFKTS